MAENARIKAFPKNKARKFRFWRWYLTNAVLNLIDVEGGMEQDMETAFKISVLLGGRVMFFRKNEKLWALPFANGGEVPVYTGEIVNFLITNPVLGEYTGTVGTDGVPVYLTAMDRVQLSCGYSYLIDETADDLSDNDLSIKVAQFVKRLPVVFVAHTTQEKNGLQAVVRSVQDGDTDIITTSPLSKNVERLEGSSQNVAPLSEFTEYQQYKLGQFFAMLGVNTVWNMKREHVAAAENATNGETARYNIADVVDNINVQLQEVNDKYGTDFHVVLNILKAHEIDKKLDDIDDTEGGVDDESAQPESENVPSDS